MGYTLLCELEFILVLYSLHIGHTQDAVLTIKPKLSTYFIGESLTFKCDMNEGRTEDWEYKFNKDGQTFLDYVTNPIFRFNYLYKDDSGDHQCCGHKKGSSTKCSKSVSIHVSADKPKAKLTAGTTTVSVGDRVRLICSVEKSAGWKYEWFRRTSQTSEDKINDGLNGEIRVSQGGIYSCRGFRGEPAFNSDTSNEVNIYITFSNKVIVTQKPSWSQVFRGETITLTCEVQGDEGVQWEYQWRTPQSQRFRIIRAETGQTITASISGEYSCKSRSRDDPYSSTNWSEALRLSVLAHKPKSELNMSKSPVEDKVILSCSVKSSSSGWRFFWFREEKSSKLLTKQDADFLSNEQIRVSQEGVYRCRGGRGEPVYHSEFSDPVTISVEKLRAKLTAGARVGGEVTLSCSVEKSTGWKYEWFRRTSKTLEEKINDGLNGEIRVSQGGIYSCRGFRGKPAFYSDTSVEVTIDEPVLRVSPRWLSPGSSVTLSCEVEHESAGWSFYWYKAVPDLSHKSGSYSYELLPASSNGTADNSYIIHGQTHTAGYVCRAGRGEPHVYTLYSQPHFVWSGDLHPSASLSVSPDRVQHFTSDSVSLTCEGNSAEWRVGSFLLPDLLSFCSDWGTMNGSTCHVQKIQSSNAVFWCESGSAFSNAVNITGHYDDLILLSPVHPVTEGHSVTLGCKWRTENLLSKVFFYQNDTLIQSESRVEMIIPAVSKSHEGFYKCQSSGKESPQSWLAVKSASRPDSSSLPVLMIVRAVCVFLLMIFPLMFYLCKKSKDSNSIRSDEQNQNKVPDENDAEQNIYGSLLHGDFALYESFRGLKDKENRTDCGNTDECCCATSAEL
ncbi:Fc receptor-like protein 5 isoform X2 [Oryzias melastigma]|uniref:Fc receptor-like protein 5 isoform X2 n=1 Tax=Oryzias melastigma TaxID=30732 RepID=UPI000CF8051A|nr:Fc receptor-like protein 5 isoform X2 [Oryzias melastigma]